MSWAEAAAQRIVDLEKRVEDLVAGRDIDDKEYRKLRDRLAKNELQIRHLERELGRALQAVHALARGRELGEDEGA